MLILFNMESRKRGRKRKKIIHQRCDIEDVYIASSEESEFHYSGTSDSSDSSSDYSSDASEDESTGYKSDSEDEKDFLKKNKRLLKKRTIDNKQLGIDSDSEEEDLINDRRKTSPSKIIKRSYSSDSDIQIIEELAAGTTTITRTAYKINDLSSNTYSSDNNSDGLENLLSDSDMDIISTTTISSLVLYKSILRAQVNHVMTESSEPPPQPPQPPQPQVPTTYEQVIVVKTPDLMPYATVGHKNGKPYTIPAPIKLPPFLKFRVIDPNQTINEIKQRLNTSCDEIVAMEEEIPLSLICPISNKRVVTPCRSSQCHHFDCFDINQFLLMNFNKKVDDWTCPKCKARAMITDLIIDSLVMHIINHESVVPSVELIKFDKNGVWIPDIKLPEIHMNKNSDPNVISLTDNTEDIIVLDDDDDEYEEPTPPPQSANVSNVTKKIINNVCETLATAKSIEQNLSNMIQTNRSQNNPKGGNSGDPCYDRILHFLKSTEQEISQRPRTQSRWSDANPNPQQTANPNPTFKLRPSPITIRLPLNRVPINSQQSTGKQPQHIRLNTPSQPPPLTQVITTRAPTPVFLRNTTNPATNSAPQKSNDCNFKFIYGSDNTLTVFCPLCNESFRPDTAEQHKKTAKHQAFEQKVSNTASTTNRAPPQRHPPPAHQSNSVRQNNVPAHRPIQTVQSTRPQIRTYSNYTYNTDNIWNGTAPQQPLYNTHYQYTFPASSITNNFYAQNPPYIQMGLPLNQPTNTPNPNPNVFNNQINPNYTYPQNQPNGYYYGQ